MSKMCILGATGCVGIELTAHLLKIGNEVLAVVRDKTKLQKLLKDRHISIDEKRLTVMDEDLFEGGSDLSSSLSEALLGCSVIFNTASPKMSWVPWSRLNRNWGSPVSDLTKRIVAMQSELSLKPHLFVLCGSEYFNGFNKTPGVMTVLMSRIMRSLYPFLRDNYEEVEYLINSSVNEWTVLRCGSIRPGEGSLGEAGRVEHDLYEDHSDYRRGKGVSLLATDLAAYLAQLVNNDNLKELSGQMPFLYNIEF